MTVHVLRKKIIVSCSNQLSPVVVSRRVNVFFIWLLEVASSSKSGKCFIITSTGKSWRWMFRGTQAWNHAIIS